MIEEMMINSFGPGLVAPLLFTIMIGQKTKKTNLKKRASGLWGVAVSLLLKLKLINFRSGSRTATDKP